MRAIDNYWTMTNDNTIRSLYDIPEAVFQALYLAKLFTGSDELSELLSYAHNREIYDGQILT